MGCLWCCRQRRSWLVRKGRKPFGWSTWKHVLYCYWPSGQRISRSFISDFTTESVENLRDECSVFCPKFFEHVYCKAFRRVFSTIERVGFFVSTDTKPLSGSEWSLSLLIHYVIAWLYDKIQTVFYCLVVFMLKACNWTRLWNFATSEKI